MEKDLKQLLLSFSIMFILAIIMNTCIEYLVSIDFFIHHMILRILSVFSVTAISLILGKKFA